MPHPHHCRRVAYQTSLHKWRTINLVVRLIHQRWLAIFLWTSTCNKTVSSFCCFSLTDYALMAQQRCTQLLIAPYVERCFMIGPVTSVVEQAHEQRCFVHFRCPLPQPCRRVWSSFCVRSEWMVSAVKAARPATPLPHHDNICVAYLLCFSFISTTLCLMKKTCNDVRLAPQ
uniref:Uncharacterized protein n=1 Tax=Lygus hesperus TaxID=30085 RepID=A0A146LFB4_LYGHE